MDGYRCAPIIDGEYRAEVRLLIHLHRPAPLTPRSVMRNPTPKNAEAWSLYVSKCDSEKTN